MLEIVEAFRIAQPLDCFVMLIVIAGTWEGVKCVAVEIAESRDWL